VAVLITVGPADVARSMKRDQIVEHHGARWAPDGAHVLTRLMDSIFCKRKFVACRTLSVPCHTRRMVQFTIVPRGQGYWIEAIRNDGSRQSVERYDTEDAAVRRLRILQEKAGIDRLEPRQARDWRG